MTERFAALSSHYLFEPCFARPGTGHDKGAVEARGKGIRLQHRVPIPQGRTLSEIAFAVLPELTRHAADKQNAVGESVAARFAAEQPCLRALPGVAFDARQVRLLEASRQATVQIDGAVYSVPSRWAGLEITALVGVEDIRLVCPTYQGAAEVYTRKSRGTRSIRYRHSLPELAREPQAVRQVAPELTAELGEPYGELWHLLVAAHGGLEAGRTLARLLVAVTAHGEEAVRRALTALLATAKQAAGTNRGAAEQLTPAPVRAVEVPAALQGYTVEAGRASDYDWLLAIGAVGGSYVDGTHLPPQAGGVQ